MKNIQPSLFGLSKTNRDFTQRETWGKNQFDAILFNSPGLFV